MTAVLVGIAIVGIAALGAVLPGGDRGFPLCRNVETLRNDGDDVRR